MRLRIKILIGILITLIGINGFLIIYDIRKEIQLNKELTEKEIKTQDKVILDIYKELINLYEQDNKIIKNTREMFKVLNKKIDLIPNKINITKSELEFKLRQAVVIIYNKTREATGSGVSIKYNNKFYILSAGHMARTTEDILVFGENGMELGELEIIKHDFDMTDENITKAHDLILLRPKNKTLKPKYYVELADFEVPAPTEIYIIGNPVGIEDVLCDGRIIQYIDNFVYYIDHTYYGNSGGGIFSKDGKLLGIVSHLYPYDLSPYVPPYMTYGAVRLDVIKNFLKDIE